MISDLEDSLEEILKRPLPGSASYSKMIPYPSHDVYSKVPEDHKEAAVLLVLFQRDSEWYLIYMKRTTRTAEDKHSGQISFPGGKYEPFDKNYEQCAIREAVEELGISQDSIQIKGALSPIYVFVSRFVVYPYVAVLSSLPEYEIQVSEVDQVYEVPLKYILDENNIAKKDLTIRNQTLKDVPYIDIEGENLWGATAMITSEFVSVIQSATQYEK